MWLGSEALRVLKAVGKGLSPIPERGRSLGAPWPVFSGPRGSKGDRVTRPQAMAELG